MSKRQTAISRVQRAARHHSEDETQANEDSEWIDLGVRLRESDRSLYERLREHIWRVAIGEARVSDFVVDVH